MKCEEAGDLFSEYISGDIESALTVSLENHLTSCTDCREAVTSLRAVWYALDDMEAVDPPAYFHENIMGRLYAEETAREEAENMARFNWRALFRPRTLAYAASAAFLLFAGMGGLHYAKASLDPVGSILNMFHRSPVQVVELSSSRAEWSANAQGTGTLTVYLKAQPAAGGKSNALNCVVNVPAELLIAGTKTDTTVSSDVESSIELPLKSAPNAVSVTISPAENGQSVATRTEPVELMTPVPQR